MSVIQTAYSVIWTRESDDKSFFIILNFIATYMYVMPLDQVNIYSWHTIVLSILPTHLLQKANASLIRAHLDNWHFTTFKFLGWIAWDISYSYVTLTC